MEETRGSAILWYLVVSCTCTAVVAGGECSLDSGLLTRDETDKIAQCRLRSCCFNTTQGSINNCLCPNEPNVDSCASGKFPPSADDSPKKPILYEDSNKTVIKDTKQCLASTLPLTGRQSQEDSNMLVWVIIGSSVGGLVLILVGAIALFMRRRNTPDPVEPIYCDIENELNVIRGEADAGPDAATGNIYETAGPGRVQSTCLCSSEGAAARIPPPDDDPSNHIYETPLPAKKDGSDEKRENIYETPPTPVEDISQAALSKDGEGCQEPDSTEKEDPSEKTGSEESVLQGETYETPMPSNQAPTPVNPTTGDNQSKDDLKKPLEGVEKVVVEPLYDVPRKQPETTEL